MFEKVLNAPLYSLPENNNICNQKFYHDPTFTRWYDTANVRPINFQPQYETGSSAPSFFRKIAALYMFHSALNTPLLYFKSCLIFELICKHYQIFDFDLQYYKRN